MGEHKGLRKPKINRGTCIEQTSAYFSEYCYASGVHGIRYLGERNRYLIERILWLIFIVIVSYFCIVFILHQYQKWKLSPVLVTFATTEKPIWNIPFPAITICPEVKSNPTYVNYSKLFFDKLNNQITPEDEFKFDSLNLICNRLGFTDSIPNIHNAKFVTDEVIQFLFAAQRNLSELSDITWLGKRMHRNVLSVVLTEEGPCLTFNMLHISEILRNPKSYMSTRSSDSLKSYNWSLEKGYPDVRDVHTFPRRTFVGGIDGGATFVFYTNHTHLDYLCGDALQGFKVVLHHPSELPDLNRHVRLPLDEAVAIGIKPRMIKVSEEVKHYTPQQRNCYFSDQRPLRYYNSYSQNNYFRECQSNVTLKKCECIPFYMPKDLDTPTCGPGSQACVDDCKVSAGVNDEVTSPVDHCNCLPSCTSLEYDVEISQSYWHWREIFNTFKAFQIPIPVEDMNYNLDHMSMLSVYYKELKFLPSERHELYSYSDFFSNAGGLLGLFTGFSITSLVEIVYFLTLRWICNIKKFGVFSGESGVTSQRAKL